MSGETIELNLEFPPGLLAELSYEAERRGLTLDQLITFWLENDLRTIRDTEERYRKAGYVEVKT